jgi:DMSO/TMAO reductase YedYZ molybdopterin-dependent catalytic subunit
VLRIRTSAGAFLATHMNGVPLPLDHGAPVRLFVAIAEV